MSNEYYNNDTKITPFTKASSSDVDADFDAIATGFDKLPEPHASAPVTKGFAEVFEIVDGTDEAHPAPISQIRDAVFYGTCAGSANTYAITLTPAPSAYTAGMTILFKPSASNTGASTVNVNSLGARNVKSTFGADPGANEIYASNYALMTYDGTNFILLNPAGGTTGSVVTTDDVDDTPVDAATTAPISSNWAYDHVAAADPHTGYVREADIDDTPVNGVTDAPISSNWAYDHVAAADPHTGYVREADIDDTPVNGVTDAPISSNWAYDHLYVVSNPHNQYMPKTGGTFTGTITMSDAMVLGTQQIRYGSSGTPYLTFASAYWELGINSNERVTFSNNVGLVARFSDLTSSPGKGFFVTQGDTTYGKFAVSNLGEAQVYGTTSAILQAGSRQVLVDSAAFFPWITTLNLGKNSTDFAWNNIYYTGTSNDISDERLKDISSMGDVSWLYNVNPISFVWKDGDDKRIRFGFGAQSLYEILPERLKDNSGIVARDFDEEKNDYSWAVSKTELIAPMLKLIQEQKKIIDSLTERITKLESQLR